MGENEPAGVPPTALGPIRTLAIRITDGLRAQPGIVAQRNDRSVTEEIRLVLEAWVETLGAYGRAPQLRWTMLKTVRDPRVARKRIALGFAGKRIQLRARRMSLWTWVSSRSSWVRRRGGN